ncbi:MAG: Peptidase [Deltaproteobacteria bacterium]|nr:Peptidase [Deltaproteobacteria bacterium]
MRRKTARKKRTGRSLSLAGVGGAPARRSTGWVVLVLGALVVVNLYVFVWDKNTSVAAIKDQAASKTPAAALPSQPLIAPPPSVTAPAPVGPPGTIDGKVGKSDTLGRLLKKSGLSAAEADEIIRALAGVLDFKTIRAGQTYHLERGADGRVRKFELAVSKIQTVHAERATTGELVGKADTSQTRTEVKTIGGKIESSLYATIKSEGETAALVDFFVDVFAYDLDFFNDTQDGDTFRVVVEKEYKDKEFLRYKRILAAEYQGKAGTFRTYYYAPPASEGGYFDAEGMSAEKTLLKTPLKFQRVTSGFDRKRMHPVLHTVAAHLGIDYAAPVGTAVWAAAPGTITHRGPAGGAGNLIMIKHDGGIETAYMHLSKFADIKVGQKVPAKTIIGYVGTTGLSTGPHLHFGVKQNGAWIDPSKLAPVRSAGVASRDLVAFRTEMTRLETLLTAIKIAAQ